MSAALVRRLEKLEERLSECERGGDGNAAPQVAWTPFPDKDGQPSPQRLAYDCQADELFFGGGGGGGKTDLLLGLAFTAHRSSVIFRRIYKELQEVVRRSKQIATGCGRFAGLTWTMDDGRVLDFAAVQHEEDKEKYRGNPHDGLFFDELPLFSRTMYQFLIGWNRNAQYPGQRCRVVCTGNPPAKPEDRWVVEEWAPWLDSDHPDPAEPGELRWYSVLDGRMTWFKPGEEVVHVNKAGVEQRIMLELDDKGKALPFAFTTEDGRVESIHARSRTFIPARIDDNPVLLASGYKAVLQAKPEPLRSQLLYGDFKAGMQDDDWQVIPSAWVRAAQERWRQREQEGWTPEGPPTAMGVDPARGGACKTVLSKRWDYWFAQLEKHPGASTPDGPAVVGLILASLARGGDGAAGVPVRIDVCAIGSSPFDLARHAEVRAEAINFGKGTGLRDRAHVMRFANLRAWAYWNVRELLDPMNGEDVCLPPDPELLADLCAAHWFMAGDRIQIEKKEDIIDRIGRSPDCADAVVNAAMPMKAPWRIETFGGDD